ncbi:MAG: DNA polymerase I, partial [bacterium]|nr:DNA polymerase I [bacterium]
MDWLDRFDSVWSIDFEFSQPPGERPQVVCMVAREYKSQWLIRMDMETLVKLKQPPFDVGSNALCVAYFSSAEWNCFLSLGWPLPHYVLDLWTEFRCLFNGTRPACGWGLLSCLTHFGFDSM